MGFAYGNVHIILSNAAEPCQIPIDGTTAMTKAHRRKWRFIKREARNARWGLFPAGDYFAHGLDNSRWRGLASFPVTYTELLASET